MKLNTLFSISAFLALIWGLGFLLAPVQTIAMYGPSLEGAGPWITRYWGTTFLGFAVLNWLARNAAESEARRAIVLANFVIAILGFLVAIMDAFFGVGNGLVWLSVVIYLVLAFGFGYFQFVKKEASQPAPVAR